MNRENIQKLIDRLEQLEPARFDMADYILSQPGDDVALCETVACIAGHGQFLKYKEEHGVWPKGDRTFINLAAAAKGDMSRWLDLDDKSCSQLFTPRASDLERTGLEYATIETKHAVKVLENLLETGKVDWKAARP